MMERSEWLKQVGRITEVMYDRFAPLYWVTYGFSEDDTHQAYLHRFLSRIAPGRILSAGCGAGRYDGLLLEAGHSVLGIDQSAGMLARAREHFPAEHFPQLRYQKLGLQELALEPSLRAAFDGIICLDAVEHISPEDYPGVLLGFQQALKPGGVLYFTADTWETAEEDGIDLEAVYQRATARGLPVVYGEWVDELAESYAQASQMDPQDIPDDVSDKSVYHYYPSLGQVRAWIDQAGLTIAEEGLGSGWYHFIIRKEIQ